MKLLTWNVNGIRAVQKKGFNERIRQIDADFVCLQETKAQPDQIDVEGLYPYVYMNCAEKKGYSGTLIMTKTEPEKVTYGINMPEHDKEGRVLTLEYDRFYVVDVYTPNSGEGLKRLDYRMEWDKAFGRYIASLDKPVLLCGDFNVANQNIDIYDPLALAGATGFTNEERKGFRKNLLSRLVDAYRVIHPADQTYTWWSYVERGREQGKGWRIDYWLVSPSLKSLIEDVQILDQVQGSDHCPVLLTMKNL